MCLGLPVESRDGRNVFLVRYAASRPPTTQAENQDVDDGDDDDVL